jgi:hypothetical protein
MHCKVALFVNATFGCHTAANVVAVHMVGPKTGFLSSAAIVAAS